VNAALTFSFLLTRLHLSDLLAETAISCKEIFRCSSCKLSHACNLQLDKFKLQKRSTGYRYGGQGTEKAVNSNWVNYELRQYNPLLGRFMSYDPYHQFQSPYLAMANNPVSFIDPSGRLAVGGVTGTVPNSTAYFSIDNLTEGGYSNFWELEWYGSGMLAFSGIGEATGGTGGGGSRNSSHGMAGWDDFNRDEWIDNLYYPWQQAVNAEMESPWDVAREAEKKAGGSEIEEIGVWKRQEGKEESESDPITGIYVKLEGDSRTNYLNMTDFKGAMFKDDNMAVSFMRLMTNFFDVEITGWLTHAGLLVMPIAGQNPSGEFQENTYGESYTNWFPLRRTTSMGQPVLVVAFNGGRFFTSRLVHTHPTIPNLSEADWDIVDFIQAPVYTITGTEIGRGTYTRIGTEMVRTFDVIGTRREYSRFGNKSIIKDARKFPYGF